MQATPASRLIGQSRPHLELVERLTKIAPTDVEVLIVGPTGTGKELYARHCHARSLRCDGQFIAVNCGAVPHELFENELFGHSSGAYTGARAATNGLVAEAEGGTLFLDEIDALSLGSQVKLLRFIQQKEYRRLGDARIRRADVRFIAATNTDLAGAVRAGVFREDLYYRLRVVPLDVPALRDRREDIPLLIDEYAQRSSDEYRLPRIVLSPGAQSFLHGYAWPGNVRELENCVRFLTCLQLARAVDRYDLPLADEDASPVRRATDKGLTGQRFSIARSEIVSEFEKRYVREALRKARGNISRAAADSGEYRKKIARLIKKYGLGGEHTGLAPLESEDDPGDCADTNPR